MTFFSYDIPRSENAQFNAMNYSVQPHITAKVIYILMKV